MADQIIQRSAGADRTSLFMHTLRSILLCFSLLMVGHGCTVATYDKAVANTVKSEPNVVAFEKLFPGSDHSISYYTGSAGTPRWNSKAMIHGRYILTMQFDVSIGAGGTTVTAVTAPQFYLSEVSDVARSASGQTSITYNTTSQRQFGLKEWKVLESSGGDLSILGVEVIRDQPIPNLSANWRGA